MSNVPDQPRRQWQGELSGLPFFLLWTAVTSVAMALEIGNVLIGFASSFTELREGSIIALFGCGSGLLAFRNRLRQLSWMTTWIALYAAVPCLNWNPTVYMFATALIQAALLWRIRDRPWIWLGLPLLVPAISIGGEFLVWQAIELALTIPSFAQFLDLRELGALMWIGKIVIPTLFLGAAVAWGMPPLARPAFAELPPGTDDEPAA